MNRENLYTIKDLNELEPRLGNKIHNLYSGEDLGYVNFRTEVKELEKLLEKVGVSKSEILIEEETNLITFDGWVQRTSYNYQFMDQFDM